MYEKKESIREFWNARAGLGLWAGTNDVIAKEIEMNAISKYLRDGMEILELGCGNGVSAIQFVKNYDVDILATDFAVNLLEEAEKLLQGQKIKGKLQFKKIDVLDSGEIKRKFDIIYTERVLINLLSWEAQKKSIINILGLLKPNGIYLMCENSEDGLIEINSWRSCVGLPSIDAPWHNRYFKDSEIEELRSEGFYLDKIDYYSSTYYFLSRIVNARMAQLSGIDPIYDSPINEMALKLPPLGRFGQGRIWVWKKV